MNDMMMMGGYEGKPSFKMYGVKVTDVPDGEFEATVTLKITRQDTPMHGEPSVEFTVLDLQSDAIELEKVKAPKNSDDMLDEAFDAAVKKKAMKHKGAAHKEGEED